MAGIADEELQRRSWFGMGPEQSSPEEDFCQFFGDAAIEEFLNHDKNGLNDRQLRAGRFLLKMMKELSSQTPSTIEPSFLIDDPRWIRIRAAAARFSVLLESDSHDTPTTDL